MLLSVGTRLGPYEILAALGAGGMGEVYRARDTNLDRDVAIKVLPKLFAEDRERVARFAREAKTLAALNHPHIAQIHGLEDSNGVTGLVMELVDGPTLAERIARGPIPLDEALAIARQIAEALEAAHEIGIVHRDLKPANIKVRDDGTVKVLDFGLAKALDRSGGAGGPGGAGGVELTSSPTLTSPAMMTGVGVILGTAAYMAPEQTKGRAVDRRADIWAFGCVLYEMLAGRRAFPGDDMSETFAAILRGEPDWTALLASTPSRIIELLRRCLRRSSQERLRDIGDARIEIDAAMTEDGQPHVPDSGSRGRERTWIAAAATSSLAALALGSWIAVHSAPPSAPVRFLVYPPEKTMFSMAGPGLLSVSPDGRSLAFVAGAERPSLWIRPLGSLTAQPLAGTDDSFQPFWSPDNRSIGYNVGSTSAGSPLKKIDASGAAPLTLAPQVSGRGAWSLSGFVLFTGAGGVLYSLPDGGGDPVAVTSLETDRHETTHMWPVFLQDGRRFVFLARSTDPSKTGLYLASLDSRSRTHLIDVDSSVEYAPGYLLYHRSGVLMAHPFDEARGRLFGDAVQIAQDVYYNPANGRGAFSVSRTGVLAYRTGGGLLTTLAWIDRTGRLGESIPGLGSSELVSQPGVGLVAGIVSPPRISPDGRMVAIARRADSTDLWLVDLQRGAPTRLTFGAGENLYPVWSPDGSSIVFGSDRRGRTVTDLYRRSLTANSLDELLLASDESKVPTGFSPDGTLLLFMRDMGAGKANDVWALPMTGDRKPFPVIETPFVDGSAVFSPDGRWIAYISNESGSSEVYVRSFPGRGPPMRLSSDGGMQPSWSSDGRTLYYLSHSVGIPHLMAVDVAPSGGVLHPGVPRELFAVPGQHVNARAFAVDPTSDRFLFAVETAAEGVPITVVVNWQADIRKR